MLHRVRQDRATSLTVIRFSDEPCLVSNSEMELTVAFQYANGGEPSTCGYEAEQGAFRLDKLFLTYDVCPRVVEYGIIIVSAIAQGCTASCGSVGACCTKSDAVWPMLSAAIDGSDV